MASRKPRNSKTMSSNGKSRSGLVKCKVRAGDEVVVISGKSSGHRGKVLSVDSSRGKLKVEGAAMLHRHVKPNNTNPQGGIVKEEGFIDQSNVMIWDAKSGKVSRRKVSRD